MNKELKCRTKETDSKHSKVTEELLQLSSYRRRKRDQEAIRRSHH